MSMTYMANKFVVTLFFILLLHVSYSQGTDTSNVKGIPDIERQLDSNLRITNINPFFSLHVDSAFSYQLSINKETAKYYWYLKSAPVGIKINEKTGMLSYKPSKSLFLSGKLKYDMEYPVLLGVKNLNNPVENVDTSFKIVFYNTEIIVPRIKPTVNDIITIDEGETLTFKLLCEEGNFSIEHILFRSSVAVPGASLVQNCNDEFIWTPSYSFVKDTDSGKVKSVLLYFIGTTRYKINDTAIVKVIVRNALDYNLARIDYDQSVTECRNYILTLKYAFLQLDKKIKKTRKARTSFDLASASTTLAGTILNTSTKETAKTTGKILPGVGVALVPVKEASAPNKTVDQNQASVLRTSIKRLEYFLFENKLIGDFDATINAKTQKIKDELRQIRMQLIDIPIDETINLSEKELNEYFNNPKVNKKYRLKG